VAVAVAVAVAVVLVEEWAMKETATMTTAIMKNRE
jgi:hypothetical protein